MHLGNTTGWIWINNTNINLNPVIGLKQILRNKQNRCAGNNGRCENDIRIISVKIHTVGVNFNLELIKNGVVILNV